MRVSSNGGQPEVILDQNNAEDLVFGPQLLPDGGTLMFSTAKRSVGAVDRWDSSSRIVAQSLQTGVRKTLIEAGSDAQYVPTGHIVYALRGTLFAVPFDLATLEVTGQAVPVLEGVRRGIGSFSSGQAQFAFSNTG